jgi:D-aspartate ligase
VDFPYLLYADQVGEPIERAHAKAGVGWLRAITDLPTAALDLWDGEIDLRTYWTSLRNTRAESVFCLQDPLPSVAEVVMLPYLVAKKYFVKSGGKPKAQAAVGPRVADLPVERSVE